MNVTIGRTLVAVVTSAGLVVGGAASASASSGGYDKDKDKYGWVKVCQEVKKDNKGKDDKGKDDKKFRGQYKVKDKYGDVSKFWLQGKDACYQVKVHEGWVNVKVVKKPDHTKLKGYEEQKVYVKKGKYEKVTFKYDAKKDKDYSYAA
jgi:hypothetical protein